LHLLFAAVVFAGTAASVRAQNLRPPSGTAIPNTARVEYLDPAGTSFVRTSNQTVALVTEMPVTPPPPPVPPPPPPPAAFTLTPDNTVFSSARATVVLPHLLTNTGQIADSYGLDLANLAGDDYDLALPRLVIDANRNGLVDPGETVLRAASAPLAPNAAGLPAVTAARIGTVSLAIGESVALLLVGEVPATVTDGQRARLELLARSALSSTAISNFDTITVRSPRLTLSKTAAPSVLRQGETVTYTLSGGNTGAPAGPLATTVDGVPASLVVLRDVIPANTAFARFTTVPAGARALIHLRGAATNTYVTASPADLTTVDAIAFGFPSLSDGSSFTAGFAATVNRNASGPVTNTAELSSLDGSTPSNPVTVTVAVTPPIISFFGDPAFFGTTNTVVLGSPLHIQVDGAACNILPLVIETITVIVESALTGDRESYTAVETGPNTGIFRVIEAPTANGARTATVRSDGTLQSLPRDNLTVSVPGCGATLTVAIVQIDPAGFVYDSITCEPVANVTVTLIDVIGAGNGGRPGQLATVLKADGINSSPNPVTTGADGFYEFPLVRPSLYRIEVTGGPVGSVFPSRLPANCPTLRPPTGGSSGGTFPVDTTTGAVFIDIAVDVPLNGGLTLEKTASRPAAERGDAVLYTLRLFNGTDRTLRAVDIDDTLPAGFTYERGSAKLANIRQPDPTGGIGPRLTFPIGDLEPKSTRLLTYRIRIERDAPLGLGVNTAVARGTFGPTPVASNVTRARVLVEEGALDDRGVIIGKVFVDGNRDRVQSPSEPGVPGIRLYLQDGTSAVTDSEGKFSFYGQRPITHSLKLDRTTLPPGAELLVLDTRHAADPGSRFVDLKRGELHKADFALSGDSPDANLEIARRRAAGEISGAEIERTLRERLETDARPRVISDARALPASGSVAGAGPGPDSGVPSAQAFVFSSVLPTGTLTSGNSSLAPAPVATVPHSPLELYVAQTAGNDPAFLGLKDGDTLASRQTTVRIKGPLGSAFSLLLNDRPVPASQVGTRAVDVGRQLEALEFFGLELRSGENTLTLLVRDSFGNERTRLPLRLFAPDRLAKIALRFSNPEPIADGRTPVAITVALTDAAGTPVSARTPLTLETTAGRWLDKNLDLDPVEPGIQVFIIGGRATFDLLPPDAPADGRLVISSGAIKAEATIPFLPDLRPLVASGILEGKLFLRSGSALRVGAITAADAFEEELRELSSSGDLRATGRAAFFLKGKIKGDLLLTAAYDTDKKTNERLFRDIEPDRYYPVYGDSSIRGYDAQSTRRLYVRIDRKKSYLLLGDFQTQTQSEQRQLGNYQRSLNGVRAHYETPRVVANAWASKDTTRQVIEEIPADGTSGPYRFRQAAGLLGSEKVELITRDRNQRALIIDTVEQIRFTDYEFEPFTGRLLFRRPVRSLDENLNPRFIRVTYEVDQGGLPFWVYGGDAQLRVTDRLEVGGSAARDENPLDQQTHGSANATVKLGAGTFLLGEIARTETDIKGTGLAGRVDLRHRDDKTEARVYYGQTDGRYANPGASLTPGRIESGLKVSRELDSRNRLVIQGLITEDTSRSGGRREGLRADLEHTFANRLRLEGGGRWSQETGLSAGPTTRQNALTPGTTLGNFPVTPFEVRALRLKATAPLPYVKDAAVFGEYEQDIVKADQRLVAVGGDWQFSSRGRLYARHEIISALGGPFELNSTQQNNVTVFGIETDYVRDGRFFNEYRARDAFNGREAEAATGLRNAFTFASGLRLQASLERVTPFDGTTQNESTSVATGADYTDNPLWKGSARVELRFADSADSVLNTFGYARKLSRDWTGLAKTIVYHVDNKAPGSRDSLQARILSGLAWRQTDTDVWNALGKYEYRYEDGSPFDVKLDALRQVHILSLSANWQPNPHWILSSRYAAKYVDETLAGDRSRYFGHILSGRILREITKRWDAGLSLSAGASRGLKRYDWAVGPEIGYNAKNNLRIGLGYNVVGFYDRDLVGDQPTSRGVFINLRLKFDESFFGWGNNSTASHRDGARALPPPATAARREDRP